MFVAVGCKQSSFRCQIVQVGRGKGSSFDTVSLLFVAIGYRDLFLRANGLDWEVGDLSFVSIASQFVDVGFKSSSF